MDIIAILYLFVSFLAGSIADFSCVCNYNVELFVYSTMSDQSTQQGTLYEFDCKETIPLVNASQGWAAIALRHSVGYVKINDNVKQEICPGDADASDIVTTTTGTTLSGKSGTTVTSSSRPPSTTPSSPIVQSSIHTTTAPVYSTTTSTTPPPQSSITTAATATRPTTVTTTASITSPATNAAQTTTQTTPPPSKTTAALSTGTTTSSTANQQSSTKHTTTTAAMSSSKPTATADPQASAKHTITTDSHSSTMPNSKAVPQSSTDYSTTTTTAQQSSTKHVTTAVPQSSTEHTTTAVLQSSIDLSTTTVPQSSTEHKTTVATIVLNFTNATEATTTEAAPVCHKRSSASITTTFGQNCYEVVPHYTTWAKAEADCKQREGHLMHILNVEEQQFITKFLFARYDHEVWIGLGDHNHEEHFEWSSGVPLSYTNWKPGRQNFLFHGIENCVALQPNDHGYWDDRQCTGIWAAEHPYVCQYSSKHPGSVIIG